MKTEDELKEEIKYLKQRYKDGAFTELFNRNSKGGWGVDIQCAIKTLKWVLEDST